MGEAALKLRAMTAEQYLDEERARAFRHEYVDGQIYALAGATDRHNRIVVNLSGHIWSATRKGLFQVYSSDMKLRVQNDITERFYYPDVMVTCRADDAHDLYKVAPSLLVEVMSPSTQGVDRREKLLAYQSIPELQDYLIVSTEERYVLRYRPGTREGWWLHAYRDEGTVKLTHLSLELTLDDIYEGL